MESRDTVPPNNGNSIVNVKTKLYFAGVPSIWKFIRSDPSRNDILLETEDLKNYPKFKAQV